MFSLPSASSAKCLSKLKTEQSGILLIAPVWPGQPWYPTLLETLVDYPILLPMLPDLLTDPFNQQHPLLSAKVLQLAAWKVSGNVSMQEEFRSKLQSSSQLLGAKGRTQHTSRAWSKWTSWCVQKDLDPFLCGVSPLVNFLASLFEQGLQHRSVNTICSAISVTHDRVEGFPLGQHP